MFLKPSLYLIEKIIFGIIMIAIIISPNTFNQLIYLTTGFRFLAHKKY